MCHGEAIGLRARNDLRKGRRREEAKGLPMKTVYICIGLVIGFVVGLIGASFVVDVMSR